MSTSLALQCSLWTLALLQAKPDDSQQALVSWMMRSRLAESLTDPLWDYVKKSLSKDDPARTRILLFDKERTGDEIGKLRASPELQAWQASELEQLNALFRESTELFQGLADIRDVARRRLQNRNERARKLDDRKRALARKHPGVRPVLMGGAQEGSTSPGQDISNARRGVQQFILSTRTEFRAGCIGKQEQELEQALRETWNRACGQLQQTTDELIPVITSDAYVRRFVAQGLIQGAVRVPDTAAQPLISLRECPDPQKVRAVVYSVVDAYGTKRTGIVALYERNGWILSKENEARGGFFELNRAE